MPEQQSIAKRQYGLDNISDIASWVIDAGRDFSIWILEGNMGVGKTTLAKAIGRALGVEETIASPTFSIVNEYHDRQGKSIFHFDFYRLKRESEAYDIGVEEYFDSGNLCLIEWADKIPSLLPKKFFKLIIEDSGHESRTIYFEKYAV